MKRWAIPIAVVLVAVGATVAVAAIPDANGVIHGCRDTRTGALRVIDSEAGQTCGSKEAALNWNQTGPQGPAGVSGYEYVSQHFTGPWSDDPVDGVVTCPAGKRVLEEGVMTEPTGRAIEGLDVVRGQGPNDIIAARIFVDNAAGDLAGFTVWVICAFVT
jgi:hypothetical protein